MPHAIARPKLEGNVAVGEDRRIGFAEFGDPHGRAMFWLYGTPGARRQIPTEARLFAERQNIRLVGVDRPGSDHRHRTDTSASSISPTICVPSPTPSASTKWRSSAFPVAGRTASPVRPAGLGRGEEILRTMVEG